MSSVEAPVYQPVHPWMRRFLWLAAGLVTVVGVQLFVLSEHTERFFAWTIQNPLTAAFLGAAYWSSAVLEAIAARQTAWSRARPAVPAVLLFTLLTLITTLVHLDQFHLGADQALETRLLTTVWLGVYLLVPPALLVMLIIQMRVPGAEPPLVRQLPFWLRAVVSVQSAVLVALGAVLFVTPDAATHIWPWPLTILAARAVGAWLLGLGVAAAQVMLEADWSRVRPVSAACAVFALLQGLALARYPERFSWETSLGWMYLAFLAGLLALGVYGLHAGRAVEPAQR
ncbi:MAG: hypothetical protein KA764_17280 [Anaerolineales bacterium]|nr:hypothetical protein [Anaerolineales bacterium]